MPTWPRPAQKITSPRWRSLRAIRGPERYWAAAKILKSDDADKALLRLILAGAAEMSRVEFRDAHLRGTDLFVAEQLEATPSTHRVVPGGGARDLGRSACLDRSFYGGRSREV
jgi:hypothetical protein